MKYSCRPILLTVLTLAIIFVILAEFTGIACADGVKIISASPGQTVSYKGQGSANSQVTLEVSASISSVVGSDHRYKEEMKGVNIPGGSSFSIIASPVSTFSVSGGMHGIGMTIGSVSGNVGSASMSNVPGGTYDIVVTGISNGSSVSMTVHASQPQSIGGDGTFTASISTSGLPPAVYSVKQNGQEVAKVYLGVPAPATPTPTAAPTPTVSPTAAPPVGSAGNMTMNTTSVTPTENMITNQTVNASASPTSTIWISPTAQPGDNSAGDSLWTTIELLAGAIIAGLLVGYIVVFWILKK